MRVRSLKLWTRLTLAGVLAGAMVASVTAQMPPIAGNYPPQPPTATWLDTHQRFSFGVTGDNLDAMIKAGVNVVIGGTNASGPGFAGGPWGLGMDGKYYNVYDGKPVSDETLDAMKAHIDRAHQMGAKVVGESMRFWNNNVLTIDHPEWQELTSPDAKPVGPEILKETGKVPVTGCWNSPFGDHFIKTTQAMAQRLGWDGYNLDGFGCWTHCFCPACRESYKTETGKDIPYTPSQVEPGKTPTAVQDLNDPEFRQYLKWRLHRFSAFVARWQQAMKQVNPEFAAMPWSTGPGRWWHWSFAPLAEGSDVGNRLLDAPFVELFWDFPPDQGTNLLPSFVVRYYRGLIGDRPPYMLPYYCTQGQWGMQPPQAESDFRMYTVLTNGAYCAQGPWQQNNTVPYQHYFDAIKAREPFTTGAKSIKWAAMLVGESSRLLYGVTGKRSEVPLGSWIGSGVDSPDMGKLPPGERRLPAHMESAVGVFRAMNEDHLPLDMITEQDVELGDVLKQYKVLILPNSACLSEIALGKIREFVQAGGGLVAMQESSLCDEFGTRRADFGLADLYGATFKKTRDYMARWPEYPDYTMTAYADHPLLNDPVIQNNYRIGSNLLHYIGWVTEVQPAADAKVIGWWGKSAPAGVANGTLGDETQPLVLLSERGQGRVVYLAGDIGQAYFLAPYPYERKLLTQSVRWAGNQPPPVSVDAPLCVQATFYTQPAGENARRTVVHLLNELNSSATRALPENNSSNREEVVPVGGITVTVRDPAIKRATLQPENLPLVVKPIEGGVEIEVPQLQLHSMVVAE